MARQFAIRGVKGDYRFFDKKKQGSIDRFMSTKPFGDEWSAWRERGYSLVRVDIREIAVIDGKDCSVN